MNWSEAIGLKLERGLGQRVVRLEILGVKGGERNGEAHILGENLLGILVGDHPLDEILSGLLVLVGSVLVHRPGDVIDGVRGVLALIRETHVVRQHGQVFIGNFVAFDLAIGPYTIRVESDLAGGELGGGVLIIHRAKHGVFGRVVLHLEIPQILVVIEIGALEFLLEVHALVNVLVGDWHLSHMRSISVVVG